MGIDGVKFGKTASPSVGASAGSRRQFLVVVLLAAFLGTVGCGGDQPQISHHWPAYTPQCQPPVLHGTFLGTVGCGGDQPQIRDHWPAYTPQWQALAAQERAMYLADGFNYFSELEDYSPNGNYFNSQVVDWSSYTFDKDGFPLSVDSQSPEKILYYNPVTTAQYALNQYALFLYGKQDSTHFLQTADHLISLMDAHGAMRYSIEWKFNGNDLQPGWVSGLAQGQALSVFARAWALTKDQKYVNAGNSALAFMLIPTENGGTRGNLADLDFSLSDQTTFEEITCHPDCTILNGFLYALMGLYDWGKTVGNQQAQVAFQEGWTTATHLLPYYDIGGFTAYDLRHVIAHQDPKPVLSYHVHHIALTNALFHVTGNTVFSHWRDTWEDEVKP